jgi:alpha-tubulin suppressor-like RCC1 family protein
VAVWTSSADNVLQVIPDTAPSGAPADEVDAATLHVRIVGKQRGTATITVSISSGTGEATVTELQQSIIVREKWIALSAGSLHTCAVSVDSLAYCWGNVRAYWGVIGNGTRGGTSKPAAVGGLLDLHIASVEAGETVSCAQERTTLLYCWGQNVFGELGNGTYASQFYPSIAGSGSTYGAVAVGSHHVCAGGHTVYILVCWGEDTFGQLADMWSERRPEACDPLIDPSGVGSRPRRSCIPVPSGPIMDPSGSNAPTADVLSAGSLHTCMVTDLFTSGAIMCWGAANVGQVGNDSISITSYPFGTGFSTCQSHEWWDNGFVSISCLHEPYFVATAIQFSSVSAGWSEPALVRGGGNAAAGQFESHTCALSVDSLAYCWGMNRSGQIGSSYVDPSLCRWGDTTNPAAITDAVPCSRLPTAVQTAVKFAAIGAGARHTCALGALDSLVYCWGANDVGQLGTGSTGASRSAPQIIDAPPGVRFTKLSVGALHTCAITSQDGAIYCWGQGVDGQLGAGGTANSPSALRVADP